MEVLSNLFAQYSIESIILLLIALGLSIKLVGELWEYFYNKAKKYLNYQSEKDQRHNALLEGITSVKESIEEVQKKQRALEQTVTGFDKQIQQLTERLQENTRSFIIDKHHYFVYQVKAVDDLNLQSLERHYLYYKLAGGDSFIDGLMEEIRALPRLNLQNGQVNVSQGDN
jgi:predicted RNase H-like nuclease (RuvC/YqgF family)